MLYNKLPKVAACATALIAFCAGTANAQIAQENVDVAVDVQLAATPAAISGLENISFKFVDIVADGPISATSEDQTFCVFTPTQFFNLTVSGASKGPDSDLFYVQDTAQSGTDREFLAYNILLFDVFNGGEKALGSNNGNFLNNTPEIGIDSDEFNTDDICSDGENLMLRMFIPVSSNSTPGGGVNAGQYNYNVLSQLVDGQLHSYTDTLTLIVEPAI